MSSLHPTIPSIPAELKEIAQVVNKRHERMSDHQRDNYYYSLENTYIEPLFVKSPKVRTISKELQKCRDVRNLKLSLRKLFNNLAQEFGMVKGCNFDLKLKYNNTQKKRTFSYYNYLTKAVYLNETSIKVSVGDKKRCSYLIYVLVHEMAHALSQMYFDTDGTHDYVFHFCLMEMFKHVSGISPNKVYRKVNVQTLSPLEREEFRSGSQFDESAVLGGVFTRAPRKFIRPIECECISELLGIIKSRYGDEIDFKYEVSWSGVDNGTELVRRCVPSFEHYNRTTDVYRSEERDEHGILPIRTYYFSKTQTGYRVFVEKTYELLCVHFTSEFIKHLKTKKIDN